MADPVKPVPEKRARGGKAGGGKAGMHPTHGGERMASGGRELVTEGPMPGMSPDYGAEKVRVRRRRGGSVDDVHGMVMHPKAQVYNAKDSAAMDSAENETPGFKAGGHKKKKSGGAAEGAIAAPRLDRRPRRAAGGKVSGHNPYSSASATTGPLDNRSARGWEGTHVKGVS